ncbi:hypothetical protein HUW63_35315 [Myxococcus sp. AM001]|nr:hypothetical protein [Myxococcus sp. AM001]
MSLFQKFQLAASVAFVVLAGCDVAAPEEMKRAVPHQDLAAAAQRLLPVPGCPLAALDTDGDGICDLVEAVLGTNPNSTDTDGDRLGDYAEAFGFGGILDLPTLGANPRKKDVFVEADYYPGLRPSQAALNRVITSFANAPVTNPDGTRGITLHVVVDQEIAAADADLDLSPAWWEFGILKNKYFAAARAPYFHYMVFAHQYDGGNSTGYSFGAPAHDFLVTMGFMGGGSELEQAGIFMHELGHNLGLLHGGDDNDNFKPNYLSVMNYEYCFHGFRFNNALVFDYSRVQVAAFSEANVFELVALTPIPPTTVNDLGSFTALRANGRVIYGNGNHADFNGNGDLDFRRYAMDFDGSGTADKVFRAAQNDWTALRFDGGGEIGFAAPGLAQNLGREERYLIPPEEMKPCLPWDEVSAR